MRKLIYHVASTVDGFIANPDGSFDGFPGDGDHVRDYLDALKSYDAVIIERTPDEHVEIVAGNAAGVVRSLKKKDGGDIYLCGGANLATEMFREALVDEIRLKLNPLLFGTGIPLVAAIERRVDLELLASKAYDSGVVLLTYRVRG